MNLKKIVTPLIFLILCLVSVSSLAHGVDEETKSFLLGNKGVTFGPFLYIGAKHMITYDHLLFPVYEWSTNGSILYSDIHGEVFVENPRKEEFFESYVEAYSNNMTGTLTASFEGIHGWYFRNKNKEDIVVNIKIKRTIRVIQHQYYTFANHE